MNSPETTRFEGRFRIMPALSVASQRALTDYLTEVEADGDRCPWKIVDGSSLVARDETTIGSGYDLWLAIIDRWLITQQHTLSGYIRFYGEEPWDSGILTADGRSILTRI
jgi:hypothetical protein